MNVTINRFDLDNLKTDATRALDEQGAELAKTIEVLRELNRERAQKMTTAELRTGLGADAQNIAKGATKAHLVESYVKKYVDDTSAAKELDTLYTNARADRRIAAMLNQMLDTADRAQVELFGKLRDTYISSQVSILRSAIIDRYVGAIAARVLAHVIEGHDLRTVVISEYIDAIKMALAFVGTNSGNFCNTGLRDEEEIIAANWFRQEVARRLPDTEISMDRFIF